MKTLYRWLLPKSIRGRLTLLFSVVFGAALIVTSFVCFKVFTHTHLENFDAFLFNHAHNVATAIADNPAQLPVVLRDRPGESEKHRLYPVTRTYMQLVRLSDGEVIARSESLPSNSRLPIWKEDLQEAKNSEAGYRTIDGATFRKSKKPIRFYRLISLAVTRSGPTPLVLQVAAPLTLLEEENAQFLWLLALLIPCAALLSAALGYISSRRAFSPVIRMAEQTSKIGLENLKDRISVEESDEELNQLGNTFNQLLDRVERAVTAQERFVADASHQLKTPLAIILGELEWLKSHAETSPEVKQAFRDTSQEVSQLIRLVENLLLLARMDAGLESVPFRPIRLDEALSETMNRLRPVAQRRSTKLVWGLSPYAMQPDGKIDFEFPGDEDLIRCLMENLIENAIKYSGEGQEVTARLTESENAYLFEVADQGKGMDPAEVSTIFERFWRGPVKSVLVEGAGLGLSIAQKITQIHGGSISVESEPGRGSRFQVRLRKS